MERHAVTHLAPKNSLLGYLVMLWTIILCIFRVQVGSCFRGSKRPKNMVVLGSKSQCSYGICGLMPSYLVLGPCGCQDCMLIVRG